MLISDMRFENNRAQNREEMALLHHGFSNFSESKHYLIDGGYVNQCGMLGSM